MQLSLSTLARVLFSCLILLTAESAFAQPWRQIEPLRTTRREVERLLGPGKIIAKLNRYDFEKETVDVFYLTKSCQTDRQGWNVPVGRVTSIRITPKTRMLAAAQWDLSKFLRKGPATFDYFGESSILMDEENGVSLEVYDGKVGSYTYGPKLSDKSKRCPGYSIASNKNCEQFIFNIDCSSDKISVEQTVSCRFVLIGVIAPKVFPSVHWSVSDNASLSRNGVDQIQVSLKKPRKHRVTITARITTPNYCYPVTLQYLRISKRPK